MAKTLAALVKELEHLSHSTHGIEEVDSLSFKDDNSFFSTNDSIDILKTFKISDSNIIFAWNVKELQVFVDRNNNRTIIPLENIEGFPTEMLVHREKANAFLSMCNLHIPKYLNEKKFIVRLSLLGLNGGGNIDITVNTWPIKQEDGVYKFIIPYSFTASQEAILVVDGVNKKMKGKKRETQDTLLNTLTEKIKYPINQEERALKKEVEAIKAVDDAIRKWNNTGLVKLLSKKDYERQYPHEEISRWIEFVTKNSGGICQALCIGRCPGQGGHVITCDIEGEFHSNKEQSMLHEIGHVIGLRHEHVRKDRDKYVNTNLTEEKRENCQAIGLYDLHSVMHYEFGKYSGERELFLRDELFNFMENNFIAQNCPGLAASIVQEKKGLMDSVGKTPTISEGDKKAVGELITLARIKKKEKSEVEAARKAVESPTRRASIKSFEYRLGPASLFESFPDSETTHRDSLGFTTEKFTSSYKFNSGYPLLSTYTSPLSSSTSSPHYSISSSTVEEHRQAYPKSKVKKMGNINYNCSTR